MTMDSDKTKKFLALMMINQRKINAYIMTLVPNLMDADDIMQETILVMWEKFDQFEVGTDFASWGVTIARFKIMNYRKSKSRNIVSYSDRIFQQIDEIAKEKYHDTDDRFKMLRDCVTRLSDRDQRLLKARYELGTTVKDLSLQLEKSIQYVYKRLSSIYHLLSDCVKFKVNEAGFE